MAKFDDIKEDVIRYMDTETIDSLAKRLGVGRSTVLRCFSKYRLKKKHITNCNTKKKYSVNENFFKAPAPSMAYIIGLMHADGCVPQTRNYFKIQLTDLELIEQANRVMESTYPIKKKVDSREDYNRKFSYLLQINGRQITESLIAWGIVPAKSKIVGFPHLPTELLHHFVRGVFDGDGTVSKVHSNGIRGGWMIHFTSASPLFCSALSYWLNANGIKNRVHKYKDKECWTVYVNTGFGNLEKFYALLYTDSTIAMKRKEDKLLEAMKTSPRKLKNR